MSCALTPVSGYPRWGLQLIVRWIVPLLGHRIYPILVNSLGTPVSHQELLALAQVVVIPSFGQKRRRVYGAHFRWPRVKRNAIVLWMNHHVSPLSLSPRCSSRSYLPVQNRLGRGVPENERQCSLRAHKHRGDWYVRMFIHQITNTV